MRQTPRSTKLTFLFFSLLSCTFLVYFFNSLTDDDDDYDDDDDDGDGMVMVMVMVMGRGRITSNNSSIPY